MTIFTLFYIYKLYGDIQLKTWIYAIVYKIDIKYMK